MGMSAVAEQIRAARQPVADGKLAAAIVKSREAWKLKRRTRRRATFRFDVEAMLMAEIAHAATDFERACEGIDISAIRFSSVQAPDTMFRLPREDAAAEALMALAHWCVQARLVRRDINDIREFSKRDAAHWTAVAQARRADLPARIRHYRRTLRVFHAKWTAYLSLARLI